jgi:hypothetical protein
MRLPTLSGSLHYTFGVQPLLEKLQASYASVVRLKGYATETAALTIGLENNAYALTGCDLGTGTVSTTQVNRAGYGSPVGCLDRHENTHINYESSCCTKAKACFDRYTTDDRCLNAYNTWHAATINHNECAAYTAEIACLQAALAKNPPYAAGTIRNINRRLAEAQQFGGQYCAAAVGAAAACPFNANGTII